jgi:hypothetical protein
MGEEEKKKKNCVAFLRNEVKLLHLNVIKATCKKPPANLTFNIENLEVH